MKIKNLADVEKFQEAINKCEGDVWLESVYGDRYNLKSALSQYIAMAALLKDSNEDLELFAQRREDEAILAACINEIMDAHKA
ncbi:MAG: polya polymerase [Lachnospiraceae bacterium]|jgi:hypothetical protein